MLASILAGDDIVTTANVLIFWWYIHAMAICATVQFFSRASFSHRASLS